MEFQLRLVFSVILPVDSTRIYWRTKELWTIQLSWLSWQHLARWQGPRGEGVTGCVIHTKAKKILGSCTSVPQGESPVYPEGMEASRRILEPVAVKWDNPAASCLMVSQTCNCWEWGYLRGYQCAYMMTLETHTVLSKKGWEALNWAW